MKKIKVGEEGTMDFFFWGGAEGEGERESQADFPWTNVYKINGNKEIQLAVLTSDNAKFRQTSIMI